jgi:predicted MFS family arabinose efflux permease
MREYSDPDPRGIDPGGLVTSSVALFLLVFGLLRGNAEGWGSAVIVASLGGAVLLFALFVAIEHRQARPMLDLTLFRRPAFVGVSLGTLALGAGMFAMFFYLSLYLQDILGYSPLHAGLRFLPLTLLVFFIPAATRNLSGRLPARVLLGTGLGLTSLGLFLMHGIGTDSEWTTLLPGLIVCGLGIGLANPAIGSTALGVVEPAHSGMASGFNNTCRLGGVAVGVAALGAVFQHQISTKLTELAPRAPSSLSEAVASGGAHGVPARLTDAAHEAFISGLNEILIVGGATVLVGALAAFALIRARDFAGARETVAVPVDA